MMRPFGRVRSTRPNAPARCTIYHPQRRANPRRARRILYDALSVDGADRRGTSQMRARRDDGPVIDIHCHRECRPAAEMMKVEAGRVDHAPLAYGSDLTREVNRQQLEQLQPKMDVLEVRLADMDRAGIDIQAVAVAVYQYYYWAPPEIGAKVSRIVNNELAEATARYPDRFAPLGTVPLQDTDAAIAELRRCVQELGMRGLEIDSHVEGSEIADPRLDPFWAELERLD